MTVPREGLVVRHCPAEGRYRAVVLRAAVAHEVREAVNRHFRTVLFAILEEQLLARQLRFAVVALAIATNKCCLNGRGEHDGSFVIMLFQCFQQRRGKAEVSLHKLLVVLGAVHPCKVEYKVAIRAVDVQLLRRAVEVI